MFYLLFVSGYNHNILSRKLFCDISAIEIVGEGDCDIECPYNVKYEPVCSTGGRHFGNSESYECYKMHHPYEGA